MTHQYRHRQEEEENSNKEKTVFVEFDKVIVSPW